MTSTRDAIIPSPAVDSEIHRGGQTEPPRVRSRYAGTSSSSRWGAEHGYPGVLHSAMTFVTGARDFPREAGGSGGWHCKSHKKREPIVTKVIVLLSQPY